MYNSHDLAISIKSVAKEKNIVIKDMLESCELGSNTMSSLYHGKSIAFDSVAKIADYLKVSVDYLLGRTDEPKPINGNSIRTGDIGDNSNNNNNSINISQQKKLDEMSEELLKKFSKLSFDEKLDVFNYIKNKE